MTWGLQTHIPLWHWASVPAGLLCPGWFWVWHPGLEVDLPQKCLRTCQENTRAQFRDLTINPLGGSVGLSLKRGWRNQRKSNTYLCSFTQYLLFKLWVKEHTGSLELMVVKGHSPFREHTEAENDLNQQHSTLPGPYQGGICLHQIIRNVSAGQV